MSDGTGSVANILSPENPDYVGTPKTVDKEFTYPTHVGRAANDHGVYLDDVQRREAEILRAKIEGRKPDLKNPPAVQGTPLFLTTDVRKNQPGDVNVESDVSLPVVVGVAEDNLDGYGAAKHAREVLAAQKKADKDN